jgi:hypothetical protein
VTRARLIGTGLPAPFERDPGTAVERRGVHAAVRLEDEIGQGVDRGAAGARRPAADPAEGIGLDELPDDSLGDTDVDEIGADDA